MAGISEGSVVNYTNCCFDAIESLHDIFVQPLTEEEKELEKKWMENHLGFGGLWWKGYLMYNGTIVVLYTWPGLNGSGYYTRKANYGLNVQIGNAPSNLRIVDYSTGHTGSAHDSAAFKYTTSYRYPELLFRGEEFAWADSAYRVSPRMIPVHKRPASNQDYNAYFDCHVSSLHVHSEHFSINSKAEHLEACCWIHICIILHNLCIDVDGGQSHFAIAQSYMESGLGDGVGGTGDEEDESYIADQAGEVKRQQLVKELATIKNKNFVFPSNYLPDL
ncbi:hypothetical protein Moror_7525 [Moniliophthora roreri MCA 2997]|uniref:DDE Tnp4 domain-containing protein n=1 Tax=Moniliophthora roreri (strain MCA 2997) TaxID=1381753 RepID=V2WUR3_MONRO|nr:hypothetical protein Moror_7525 [Moniliophthora roreri MCA 2997]